MPYRNGKQVSAIPGLYLRSRDKIHDAVLELANVNTAPTTTSGYHYLYVESNVLKYDNGSSIISLTGGGGSTPSWETIYLSDHNFGITAGTWAISQSANAGLVTFTKTGTGAGTVVGVANAGTGDELTLTTTRAGATGVVMTTHHDSASPADNDVIFKLAVTGDDSTGTATEYAAIQFLSTDVTDTTEDGAIYFYEMLAGTSRKVLDITGCLALFGYGANAVISSQGAYDLVLETNSGTDSGKITIADGAAGTITIAPDTTGVVALTTGIVVGGTTPTACTFAVEGSSGSGATGNGLAITATLITTGTVFLVNHNVAATLAGGLLMDLQVAGTSAFSVGENGVTTIAGKATTDSITLTAGDVNMGDGSITVVDADNAATISVTNDTATDIGAAADAGVVTISTESLTTGILLNLSADETNLNGGFYLRCYGQDATAAVLTVGEYGATTITTATSATSLILASASASSDVMQITTTALTTGDALQITSTAETLAAGELLKIVNTEDGDFSATPKTGNLASITSSCTMTTNSATLDYDTLLISRSNIANGNTKTLTAAGSVLKLALTSTNTAGTCTDSTVILEIVGADGGTAAPTGDAVKVTSVGVGAKALNITSASTSVSDVLITGSGVKASTKAVLEIASTGSTAAGGALLKVAHSGTGDPASATSYIAIFSQAAATCASNPVAVLIDGGASTASGLIVQGSGAMAAGNIIVKSTANGALGAVLKLDHRPADNSEANSDVIGRLQFSGQDDANAAEDYAKIDIVIKDVTAANPDANMLLYVDKAGTQTLKLTLDADLDGVIVGSGAAATTVTSSGSFDLTLSTASTAANEPKIVLTDGAAGDITITAGGTSGEVVINSPVVYGVQAIINANTAIGVITTLTTIANNAPSTHTLADGVVGQIKHVVCSVYTGDAVITPSNLGSYTTITLNQQGDSWTGIFAGTEWQTIALGGTAVLA